MALTVEDRFGNPSTVSTPSALLGILRGLVLGGVMIGAGLKFIETFHWALDVFGAFLVFTSTSAKMLWRKRRFADFNENWLVRLTRRFLAIADQYEGSKFSIRLEDGRRMLTPPALVLIVIEATDVLFALDSIPAIFGITHDPFIVCTSNICAFLGCAGCISCSLVSFRSCFSCRMPMKPA
jgi:predicted tellurium resistance membrane protein TerC